MKSTNRALTPRQAVIAVVVIGVVALGGYGIYLAGAHFWHRRVVKAAIPKYLDEIRAQRERLIKAIERYHAQFGFYPPNHGIDGAERARVNPLYYELVGTRWNPKFEAFNLPTTKDTIKPELMLKSFHMQAFTNTAPFPGWPTNFLEGTGLAGRQENEVIMVIADTPDGIENELLDDFTPSVWRYAAEPAEHNKGRFDVWMEVDVLGEHYTIANWEP